MPLMGSSRFLKQLYLCLKIVFCILGGIHCIFSGAYVYTPSSHSLQIPVIGLLSEYCLEVAHLPMASGSRVSVQIDGGFFTVAALVLCCYEHAITVGEEVRCVWRTRVSGGSILFVLNRYAVLASSLASIIHVLPQATIHGALGGFTTGNPALTLNKACKTSVHFSNACLILTNIAYTTFAALRIFALYGLKKRVFAMIFCFGILSSCTQIGLMVVENIGTSLWWNGPTATGRQWGRTNCNYGLGEPDQHAFSLAKLIFLLRLHDVVFETILLVLTWRKTFTRWSSQKPAIRTPFTRMLLRDGTLYFIIMAVTSGLNMAGMLMGNFFSIYNDWLLALAYTGPVVDVISSICMSRFILGLLALTLSDEDTHMGTSQWGTVKFATVAATLAGDVDTDLPDGVSMDDDDVADPGSGDTGVQGS